MRSYQVRQGESPAGIARKFGVSMAGLIGANPHKPTVTVAGQRTWKSLGVGEQIGVGDGFATVTSTKLNIRSSPSASAQIVGGSSDGDIVNVVDWNAAPPDSSAPMGWAQISSPIGLFADGTPGRMDYANGYMSKQFLNYTPATPMPIAANAPGPTPAPLPPPMPTGPAAAAAALVAQLKLGGCAGCGDTTSLLSQAVYNFKKQSLSDPNCQGFACANIYGSTYNTGAMYSYGPGTQQALTTAIGATAPAACTDSNGTCVGGATPAPLPLPAPGPAPTPSLTGKIGTITASKLNIRSAPNTSGTVLGGNSLGDTVTVLNWNAAPADSSAPNGWAQVQSLVGLNVDGSPGRMTPVTGYMSKQFVNCPSCATPVAPPTPACPPGSRYDTKAMQCVPSGTPIIPPASTCPPGQTWVPPISIMGQTLPGTGICIPNALPAPTPTPVIPPAPKPLPAPTSCPPGQHLQPAVTVMGIQVTPAMCVPDVVPVIPPTPAPAPAPNPAPTPTPTFPTVLTCPQGQILNPLSGKCEAIPTLPIPIPTPTPVPVAPVPVPVPVPVKPAPAPITPPTPSQPTQGGVSTGAVVAGIAGAAALVGVVAYAATRKKGASHSSKHGSHTVHRKTSKKKKR